MAAAEATGLTFVNEDYLPDAFPRVAYVDSDNEAPSDVDNNDGEESADEGEESAEGEDAEDHD